MAMTEPARCRLHDGLKDAIGDENAGTLMAMLPSYSWDKIAKRSDLDELRVSLDGKLEATNAKIDALDVKFEGKLDALFAKIVLANVGMTISICGLLFAVVKLGA